MLNHFCKKPLWEVSQTLVAVAGGTKPADTVIRGGKLVNVCTAEIMDRVDIAISEGRIALVGDASHCIGEGTEVIDAAVTKLVIRIFFRYVFKYLRCFRIRHSVIIGI